MMLYSLINAEFTDVVQIEECAWIGQVLRRNGIFRSTSEGW